MIVLTAFISPYRADRQRARALVDDGAFIEIYCAASINVCETRDVKGMYQKARAGLIPEFTGVSSPYEAPEKPEIALDTGLLDVDECVRRVIDALEGRGVIGRQEPGG
jgi:adenylylsulfate kinase